MPLTRLTLQALDHGPHRVDGVEVLRDDVVHADLDVEGVLDVCDEAGEVEGIDDLVVDDGGLGGEVDVLVDILEEFEQLVHRGSNSTGGAGRRRVP